MSANLVVSNLWVGDMQDAQVFKGERLCVLEGPATYAAPSEQDHHIQILVNVTNWIMPFWASRAQLDKTKELITARLVAGANLLVHCAAGIERSPLTCAWWLWNTGRHSSLAAAYAHLKAVRPQVEDRTLWLEPENSG
jgi:protein-tyrosine phosphatase